MGAMVHHSGVTVLRPCARLPRRRPRISPRGSCTLRPRRGGGRRSELFAQFQKLPEQYPEMAALERAARETRRQFFEPFTELGLRPGIVDAEAGDLIIFVS